MRIPPGARPTSRSEAQPVALVTGCSGGIGAATVGRLNGAGFRTVATSRDPSSLNALDSADLALELDVTSPDSCVAAIRQTTEAYGHIDVLVNNAGYAELGAVECVRPASWTAQFETNVVGPVRLIQLVLPGMRDRGHGRIINVSSLAGRISLPAGGAYHASKHALEAATEALRFEVRRFGVHVSLIEPGPVRTRFADHARVPDHSDSDVHTALMRDLQKQMARHTDRGVAADRVARTILRAASSQHPRLRYPVGSVAHLGVLAGRYAPQLAWDVVAGSLFPSVRAAGRTKTPSDRPMVSQGR